MRELSRMTSGGALSSLNILPLAFGSAMATLDAFMLSFIKYMTIDKSYVRYLFIPMIIYAIHPVLFYFSLKYETLTVMNLLTDLISDVIVTMIGLLVFKETIGPYKKAGVILSFISIVLMSMNDGV